MMRIRSCRNSEMSSVRAPQPELGLRKSLIRRLDVDDHHAALALFTRRSDSRAVAQVGAVTLDRKLDPTTLALTALLLFFLEDFFDDPGIQHGGPPFG